MLPRHALSSSKVWNTGDGRRWAATAETLNLGISPSAHRLIRKQYQMNYLTKLSHSDFQGKALSNQGSGLAGKSQLFLPKRGPAHSSAESYAGDPYRVPYAALLLTFSWVFLELLVTYLAENAPFLLKTHVHQHFLDLGNKALALQSNSQPLKCAHKYLHMMCGAHHVQALHFVNCVQCDECAQCALCRLCFVLVAACASSRVCIACCVQCAECIVSLLMHNVLHAHNMKISCDLCVALFALSLSDWLAQVVYCVWYFVCIVCCVLCSHSVSQYAGCVLCLLLCVHCVCIVCTFTISDWLYKLCFVLGTVIAHCLQCALRTGSQLGLCRLCFVPGIVCKLCTRCALYHACE
jgi:hypothetical protein